MKGLIISIITFMVIGLNIGCAWFSFGAIGVLNWIIAFGLLPVAIVELYDYIRDNHKNL